jgi:hypothetical protein
LGAKEVNERALEMRSACAAVDPTNSHSYYEVADKYDYVWAQRIIHFIERHNLMAQFGRRTKQVNVEGDAIHLSDDLAFMRASLHFIAVLNASWAKVSSPLTYRR